MPINAIKKASVVAVTVLSAWLAAPNSAEASSFSNPFSEAATGRLANFYDGHWIAWIPNSGSCSNVVWQYVAPITGFTENVYFTSAGYGDFLIEESGTFLCGYNANEVIHNGWGLYMMGNGGNDRLVARDSLTYMFGGDGNDRLESLGNARFFTGDGGNDVLRSCISSKNDEDYTGGPGTDKVCDASGSWSYLSAETTISCWSAQGADICQ